MMIDFRKPFGLILFLFILASCSDNKTTLYFKAEDVSGLKKGDAIFTSGLQIGSVKNLRITMDGSIVGEACIDSEVHLPEDSHFEIKSDLMGEKSIEITLGIQEKYFSDSDTAVLTHESRFPMDSIGIDLKNVLNGIFGSSKEDSLLIEIRRLNNNIEELKNNEQ